jgi:hypothetical protein
MSNNSRRLSILSAKEVDDLYGLPHFTEDERHLYFDLSTAEREVVATWPNSSEAATSRHVKLKNLLGKEFHQNLLPMRDPATL